MGVAELDVGHDQLALRSDGAVQQVEEDAGIEAAGDGDQRGAVRQREGVEMGAELVREVHRKER